DARYDKYDNDQENHNLGEMTKPVLTERAGEHRQEAERPMQPRVDVVRHERAEHEDAPESENDARNRSEHLDKRRDDPSDPLGRELAQVEPDGDRQRRRDQQRDKGADRRPVEEEQRTVVVLDRIPDEMREETESG